MGSALVKQGHVGVVYKISATKIKMPQCHTSEHQLGICTYGALLNCQILLWKPITLTFSTFLVWAWLATDGYAAEIHI